MTRSARSAKLADQLTPRPFSGAGLRARITVSFAGGALVVALVLVLATSILIRRNLLEQREQTVAERTGVNADLVADKVGQGNFDAPSLFGSLATAGKPSLLIREGSESDYRPYSVDPRYGASVLPRSLTDQVLTGRRASVMRYEHNGEVLLTVGVPIPGRDAAYFETTPLDDIDRILNSLTIPLMVTMVITAAIGGGLGWYATRRVLRPLGEISQVATDIADGVLDARLAYSEWADDPDLAQILASFNEMASKIQARIDRDARFASDVSHELRSPLMTLNATVEVLMNAREDLPERARIALDLLSSDMERMTQLVEDLLEISRFDAGAVRLELEDVDIVEAVRMAVRSTTNEPILVETDPTIEGLVVTVDKRRLGRVLANFVDNAAKYADGATRVVIERSAPPEPTEDEDPVEMFRIIVEDHGPGVPESERQSIFDRFNRGTQGGSRGRDLGTGLGLALAAEHANLQGGSVWVEGRTDNQTGSRFVIELPLIEPHTDLEREPTLDEVTAEHLAIQVDQRGGL